MGAGTGSSALPFPGAKSPEEEAPCPQPHPHEDEDIGLEKNPKGNPSCPAGQLSSYGAKALCAATSLPLLLLLLLLLGALPRRAGSTRRAAWGGRAGTAGAARGCRGAAPSPAELPGKRRGDAAADRCGWGGSAPGRGALLPPQLPAGKAVTLCFVAEASRCRDPKDCSPQRVSEGYGGPHVASCAAPSTLAA